jgi:hypothetical protein
VSISGSPPACGLVEALLSIIDLSLRKRNGVTPSK